jgi:hypothetical protein
MWYWFGLNFPDNIPNMTLFVTGWIRISDYLHIISALGENVVIMDYVHGIPL